ncbi:fam-a protein [Plasmodium vinckei vinckei]|uniref:Fam-a protein n=1 Tax=Plasmodium vinckei vinckei TaxID=54757 RepID=A0A449BWA9_PLAVN|nr:fam-a protein [Plasmodium vinckei vinckei]VEV57609.1 fam-a protein [Plasmodium vinckei vinckei]
MNKGYIKIALVLLSVAGYMKNIAFANENILSTDSSNEECKQLLSADIEHFKQLFSINSEDVERLLCTDPNEAKQAEDVAAEALAHLQYHAENTDDYYLYSKEDEGAIIYFKSFNGTDIGKLDLIIPNPDCYDDIIKMLWNPNAGKYFDDSFIKGQIARIYNINLGILHQRQRNIRSWHGYYHALCSKRELSRDETVIIMVSSNMNDHDHKNNKDYINPIVESANSFKPDIDSEEDIRNGKLSKVYINLVGFIIKKEPDYIKFTYIVSVDINMRWVPNYFLRRIIYKKILDIVKLRDVFKKE